MEIFTENSLILLLIVMSIFAIIFLIGTLFYKNEVEKCKKYQSILQENFDVNMLTMHKRYNDNEAERINTLSMFRDVLQLDKIKVVNSRTGESVESGFIKLKIKDGEIIEKSLNIYNKGRSKTDPMYLKSSFYLHYINSI